MTSEPTSVVQEYFARIRARDISIVDLFDDHATLIGLGTTRSGRDAIREFYLDVIERAGPTPRSVGPLLAHGPRVAAEILIEPAGGQTVHAIDLFVIEESRIRALTYFLCAHGE